MNAQTDARLWVSLYTLWNVCLGKETAVAVSVWAITDQRLDCSHSPNQPRINSRLELKSSWQAVFFFLKLEKLFGLLIYFFLHTLFYIWLNNKLISFYSSQPAALTRSRCLGCIRMFSSSEEASAVWLHHFIKVVVHQSSWHLTKKLSAVSFSMKLLPNDYGERSFLVCTKYCFAESVCLGPKMPQIGTCFWRQTCWNVIWFPTWVTEKCRWLFFCGEMWLVLL